MSDERFDIIFRGDILPGHQLVEVKARLKQLFKADDERINALFGGGVTPLKRNLEKAAAEKYQSVLSAAGADIQVASAGAVQARQAPVRAKPKTRAKPEVVSSVDAGVEPAAKQMTLKERLEVQEAERLASASVVLEGSTDTGGAESTEAGWSLAAVGSDLLEGAERPTVVAIAVDVSALSLRPPEGELLDAGEKAEVESVVVDVSALALGELGADLLGSEEKLEVQVLQVDTSAMNLAPAGSDLGQIKDERPQLNPDTSGLSLRE